MPQRIARAALLRAAAFAALLAAAPLAGCAQFGVPAVPPLPAAGPFDSAQGRPWPAGAVYVVYEPHTVLGFGHTGVIVPAHQPGEWLRFDHYASAELDYGERAQTGTAHFWEPVTARLWSIFGLTRERVTRRAGPSPAALRVPSEHLLAVPGLDAGAVRRAAEARHAGAAALEAPQAPRYWVTSNNCHHFTRDVLRAGGPIPERYFPKHFVEDLLAEGEAQAPAGAGRPAPR
jgi:hypothetical protein